MNSFDQYIQEQERYNAGKELEKVADVLRAEVNKNPECWLYSFGWKDADLDPEGCTGIKALIPHNDVEFYVVVGGHKTVCPENEFDEDQLAQALVSECGYSGYWTGDDWRLSFEDQIAVKWVDTPDGGDIDYAATAEAIKVAGFAATAHFSEEMAYIDKCLSERNSPEWDGEEDPNN